MAAKGYCTNGDVANFLGVTLTSAQQTHADSLIETAEAYLDRRTNRAWLVGAQTDEAHYAPTYDLFVKYPPVASVSAVKGRTALGESEETLTVDEDYEVRDLAAGHIRLLYPGSYDRVRVSYTPESSVPEDVKQATIELVALWMNPVLTGVDPNIRRYQLPDLEVEYSGGVAGRALPKIVLDVIENYRFRVHA